MSIATILKDKGGDVIRVAPDVLVRDVVRTLGEHGIGAILVMDPSGRILGILSERDIISGLAKQGVAAMELAASALMTEIRWTIAPNESIADAMRIMTDHRVRHLPVMEDGTLVGVVSIGDIVKARIQQQAHEVEHLRAYVGGTH